MDIAAAPDPLVRPGS